MSLQAVSKIFKNHTCHVDVHLAPAEPAFEVRCDVNGCIITPVAPRTKSPGAAAGALASNGATADQQPDVELHEGPGWKLVLDTSGSSGSPYDALIASDFWAVALKKSELVEFIQVSRVAAIRSRAPVSCETVKTARASSCTLYRDWAKLICIELELHFLKNLPRFNQFWAMALSPFGENEVLQHPSVSRLVPGMAKYQDPTFCGSIHLKPTHTQQHQMQSSAIHISKASGKCAHGVCEMHARSRGPAQHN